MRRVPSQLSLLLATMMILGVVDVYYAQQQAIADSGPKGDTIVIVGGAKSEDAIEWTKICVVGRWSIEADSTGKLAPQLWKTGTLFLFHATQGLPDEFSGQGCGLTFNMRLDQKLPDGFSAKAGVVYKVTNERKLEEAGHFDPGLKRTVKQLATEYLAR